MHAHPHGRRGIKNYWRGGQPGRGFQQGRVHERLRDVRAQLPPARVVFLGELVEPESDS